MVAQLVQAGGTGDRLHLDGAGLVLVVEGARRVAGEVEPFMAARSQISVSLMPRPPADIEPARTTPRQVQP